MGYTYVHVHHGVHSLIVQINSNTVYVLSIHDTAFVYNARKSRISPHTHGDILAINLIIRSYRRGNTGSTRKIHDISMTRLGYFGMITIIIECGYFNNNRVKLILLSVSRFSSHNISDTILFQCLYGIALENVRKHFF